MEKYLCKSKWINLLLGVIFIFSGIMLMINFDNILSLIKTDMVVVTLWEYIEWYIGFVAMVIIGFLLLIVSILNFIGGKK